MSELRIETLQFPAARLGPENPLPPLRAYHTASYAPADFSAPLPDYPDQGNEASILPYRLQDTYDRVKQPRQFNTAVLENEILRATFLMELGGRLWSLYHKPSGRELLHVNPVFQPANLAVRDAWFSGGVEWNLSIIGHCPFTCALLFVARLQSDDGTPILRFYEYERIRRVVFQIDIYLPDGSPFLFVRPRIINPNDCTIPMYWWSNIAVNEAEGIRVLSPADSAFYHDYDRSLKSQDLPHRDGQDVTYPTRRASAADLYFRIPPARRPWITALDGAGRGLIHASTSRLRGCKMFLWGTDPGGRHWQEHLAAAGESYIEIQGGLATTQTEYVPMPAGAKWEWLEAYGLIETNPQAVHSTNWRTALEHVEAKLHDVLPQASLEKRLADSAPDADRPPLEILQTGSGWGALERRRREKTRAIPTRDTVAKADGAAARISTTSSRETDPPSLAQNYLISPGLPFADETLGAEQQPWLRLLEDGALPNCDPAQFPISYMTDPAWREMLEEAIAAGRGAHWLAFLQLGVMRYRAGEPALAKLAWEQSLALAQSALAYRNLAVLAADEGDTSRCAQLLATAARMHPTSSAICVEACEALLAVERYGDLRKLVAALSPTVRDHGRVRLLAATAALRDGDLQAARDYFSTPCDIANIREGELTLSELWFEWHEREAAREINVPVDAALRSRVRREHPLPKEFDFRMKPD